MRLSSFNQNARNHRAEQKGRFGFALVLPEFTIQRISSR